MRALAALSLLVGCGPQPGEGGADVSACRTTPADAGRERTDTVTTQVGPVEFWDVTRAAGLDFENVSGGAEQEYIIESQSAGSAFLDYDGDGYLDLFVVNGTRMEETPRGAGNKLYQNSSESGVGGEVRVFRQVDVDLGSAGWGMGAAVGDIENDGDPDVYVTYWGPNRLYRNRAAGGESPERPGGAPPRFVEVGEQAGVADERWGTSAAFGDLDGDGYLDLYVANYVEFNLELIPGKAPTCPFKGLKVFCGPGGMANQADVVYRNNGDGGFADVSALTGLDQYAFPSMGVVFCDYDADGDLDIYVANDIARNLFLRNDGDWRLTEVGAAAGVAYSEDGREQSGMGVHSGDFDNDGWLDLFVANYSDDVNTLYRNEGGARFQDVTFQAGLGGVVLPYLSWGTAFFDYDNDGWLDLFVATGHLFPQLAQFRSGLRYPQRNLLYHNRGGRFAEVGTDAGPAWTVERVSRSASLGDFDNDGDLDLLVMNMNDTPTMLYNSGGNCNNWLGLQLIGVASNRDAIGARVRVLAGDLDLVREVHRGYGFQAGHDPRLLVGLGQRRRAERVEIRWPSGRLQVLTEPPLRQYLQVREGSDQVLVLTGAPEEGAGRYAVVHHEREAGTAAPLPDIGQPDWTVQDYLQISVELHYQGRYRESRAALEEGLRRHPDSLGLQYHLGALLVFRLGLHEEAAAGLERALRATTPGPAIYAADCNYWLGRAYLGQNRPTEAIQVLRRAVALKPSSWVYNSWLGLACLRADSLEVAAAACRRAAALAPWEPEPHLHLAEVYTGLERHEEATQERRIFDLLYPQDREVEIAEEAVLDDPNSARAHHVLAAAFAGQGRTQEALEHFQQAIELDPQHALAHLGMGTMWYRQNQLPQAIQAYQRACELQPDLSAAHKSLGYCYGQLGQYDRAIAAFQRALGLDPELAEVRDLLGQAYAAQGRLEEAIQEWEALRRADPDHPRAAAMIRQARQRLGGG